MRSRHGHGWTAFFLGACALLSACGSTPMVASEKQAMYAPYRKNPLAPVNVFINPGDVVTIKQGQVLTYLAQQFKDSGAFGRADVGVQRWPFSLDVRYEVETTNHAAGLASAVVFGGSLGIIPTSYPTVHKLTVEVFHGLTVVKKLEYAEPIDQQMSIYDIGSPNKSDRAGVDRLFARLIADLDRQKLLPRLDDLQKLPAKTEGNT